MSAPPGREMGADPIERVEWAELWPDGIVRPKHHNYPVIGKPDRPAPNAYQGTRWVKRTITYGSWELYETRDLEVTQ